MKRGLIVSGILTLLFLFAVSTAIAADTYITVKTEPNADVVIRVQDVDYKKEYENFQKISDADGRATAIFSQDIGKISLYIQVKKDGKIVDSGRFDDYISGNPININMKEEPVVEPVEETAETINETTSVNTTAELIPEETVNETTDGDLTENTEESTSTEKTSSLGKITGAAVSNIKSAASSKTTYYIIGGIFIIAVLFFVVMAMRKRLSSKNENIKVTKLSERISSDRDGKAIAEAERKIEEAKKELEEIKNKKGKIKEVQERLKKDQEELRRLQEE